MNVSSGSRIRRAVDDAAGLTIADDLHASARINKQGIRNINDGISLLQVADAAIENLSEIVVRLQELAEQAANGTYSSKQRKVLNIEAQALQDEFFRITQTTSFNDKKLFTGDFDSLQIQAGVGSNTTLDLGLGGRIGHGHRQSNRVEPPHEQHPAVVLEPE